MPRALSITKPRARATSNYAPQRTSRHGPEHVAQVTQTTAANFGAVYSHPAKLRGKPRTSLPQVRALKQNMEGTSAKFDGAREHSRGFGAAPAAGTPPHSLKSNKNLLQLTKAFFLI